MNIFNTNDLFNEVSATLKKQEEKITNTNHIGNI